MLYQLNQTVKTILKASVRVAPKLCPHFLHFFFVPLPSLLSLVRIRLYVQHGVELLGSVAQQAFQVTDKAVDVALPRRLVDDVLVVVVTKATAQFLIIHLGLVFSLPPPPGNLEQHR